MRTLAAQHFLPGVGEDIDLRPRNFHGEDRGGGVAEGEAFAIIRDGKTFMLPGVMQTGKNVGMIMMDDALAKLYRDNAATLTPDPLHSAFYDSHPPASIRIQHLDRYLAGRPDPHAGTAHA